MQHPAGRLLCNTQHAIRSRTIIRSLPAWRLFSYNSPSRSQELKFKAIESLDSGSLARTNDEINLEYTGEHDLERSTPVHGHRILHSKRTLPCFSMDGKVVVVTGGARGLGLVMSQGLVESGAEVAICDLNRDEAERQAEELTAALRRESPAAE